MIPIFFKTGYSIMQGVLKNPHSSNAGMHLDVLNTI